MLRIRLTRVGKKDQPRYRLVVAEKTAPIKGKFVEILGHYNPFNKEAQFNKERIMHWLNTGATCSNTAAKLLLADGIKHKLVVFVKKNKKSKNIEEKNEGTQEDNQVAKPEAQANEVESPTETSSANEENKPEEEKTA